MVNQIAISRKPQKPLLSYVKIINYQTDILEQFPR